MSMGWGLAKEADLTEHTTDEEPEIDAANDLRPTEVAIVSDLAAIYGTREDLVALAHRIIDRWGQ